MPKITFMIIITLTAILSLAVFGNAFAKSSGGDSGGSGGSSDGSDNKPKTSGHKKGDSSGSGGMPVPGLPLPKGVDNKHKDSNSGGLIVPGLPVVRSDGNDHDDGGSSYNNGNIKKFDTSKSSFRISGSGSEIV
jgi:hypothetical protein